MKLWIKAKDNKFVRIPHEILNHFKDGEVGIDYSGPPWGRINPQALLFLKEYREHFKYQGSLNEGRFVLANDADPPTALGWGLTDCLIP